MSGESAQNRAHLKTPRSCTLKLALIVALTLLAAFLRLHRIDRLPPGDGYDPAVYGVDALEILAGARPVYLPTNYGREAMFSYLVAVCVALLGIGPHAIYIASALVGVLTIPAIYALGEELFSVREGALKKWGGLLAAAVTAVSYWHLSWSRLGVRAILVPLFAATTACLLWRGIRTGRHWAFLGCGVSLGLSLYTYQIARALPLLVLLGLAYEHVARRSFSKRDLLDLALVALAALAIFAPMGIYLISHPEAADQRIKDTLVLDPAQGLTENAGRLWQQVVETIAVFFIRGGSWPKVNPPGRPMLNPLLAAALLLGLIASVRRFKQPRALFLLTWLGGLMVPAILATHGPTSKRAIGALPAVVLLATIGLLETGAWVRRWTVRHRPSWSRGVKRIWTALIALLLVYSGLRTYRDYFVLWGRDPDLFTHFEAGLSAMGQYIRDRPLEERIYLSSVSAAHPSVTYNSGLRTGVQEYNGRVCMVVVDSAPQDTTYLIVPGEDENSLTWLQETLPQGWLAYEGPLHYQLPYFVAYRVPAGARAQIRPAYPLDIRWGDQIQLLGFDLDRPAYRAGDTVLLTLYYHRLDEIEVDYTVFTHLLGPKHPATSSPVWAQKDSEPCQRSHPTSAWQAAEIVIDPFKLTLPADAPPGEYEIEVGFYEWPSLQRLPVTGEGGQALADHAILGHVRVLESE
jgi:hypothetical protein